MMHKALSNIEEVSYCFFRSYVQFQVQKGRKIDELAPIFSVAEWQFQFEFMDGNEITHRASRNMEGFPTGFPGNL